MLSSFLGVLQGQFKCELQLLLFFVLVALCSISLGASLVSVSLIHACSVARSWNAAENIVVVAVVDTDSRVRVWQSS